MTETEPFPGASLLPLWVDLNEIEVQTRQRKVLTEQDIAEMAASIRTYGLLNPPLLTRINGKLRLVAGFTRIQGLLQLGLTKIPYIVREETDEIILQEIELEENVRRKQLEWWEQSQAIAKIHAMRSERDPDWNMAKTAHMAGVSKSTVSQAVQLTDEMSANPEILQESTLRGALAKLDVKKKLQHKKEDIARRASGLLPSIKAEVRHGDALELIRQEPDESFDAVITNLPFGIDLEFKGGKKPYEDEEGMIIELIQEVVKECFRVLKPDSWMVAWFDIRKITYSESQRALYRSLMARKKISPNQEKLLFDSMGLAWWMEKAGFSYVTLVPGAWVKPNKTQGILGDPRKGFIIAQEAMIFASKGGAFLMKQGRNNVWIYDSVSSGERDYAMQMPTALCTEVVSMVCLGGGRILDPFAGSASIGLGALGRQCEYVGFENNSDAVEIGNMRLAGHTLNQQEG